MHAAKLLFEQTWRLRDGETVHDNVFWRGTAPRISICVPTLCHGVTPLLEGVAKGEAAEASGVVV